MARRDDNYLRWFLAVSAVSYLAVFVVRADQLDAFWVALLGSMMGFGVLTLGSQRRRGDEDD